VDKLQKRLRYGQMVGLDVDFSRVLRISEIMPVELSQRFALLREESR